MERCFRFRGGVLERARLAGSLVRKRSRRSAEGVRERERDLLVDMVETELDESADRERERERDLCPGLGDRARLSGSCTESALRLAAASDNCWSATPLLQKCEREVFWEFAAFGIWLPVE